MATLASQLEQLEYAQLVRRTSDEEAAYLFKHALTQESAYESLLVKKRRAIHRRVAEAFEQLYTDRLDEYAAVLAQHYAEAGDAAKTLEYAIRAGDAAVGVFANAEALVHYTRALGAFSRLPDTEELRRQHTDVILRYLDFSWGTILSDEDFSLATEAEALASSLHNSDGTLGDPQRLARVRVMRAGAHLARGEYQEAVRYAQEVLDQAPVLADDTLVAAAAAQMGVMLVFQGHFAEAEPYSVKAFSLMDRTPDCWEWISSVCTFGISLTMRGQTASGLAQVERALARAEATQNGFGITISRACLLLVLTELGDLSRLLEESQRAIESAVKSGHPLYTSLGLGLRALAASRSSQYLIAQEALDRAFAVKAKIGSQLMMSDWLAVIQMEVLYNKGEKQDVLARAGQVVATAQSFGGILAEGWARRIWAQALAELTPPRWEGAEEELAKSVRLLEAGGAVIEAARTHVAWGQVLKARGKAEVAREHFEKAAAQFESSGLTSELERTNGLIAALPA